MKRLIQTMLVVTLLFLTVMPSVFAQSDGETLKFNGIYQSVTEISTPEYHAVDWEWDHNATTITTYKISYSYEYYRFFPDGTIGIWQDLSSGGRLSSKILSSREALAIYNKLGESEIKRSKYTVRDGELKFTYSYPYRKGTVEYVGIFNSDGLHLNFHSNVRNANEGLDCSFIKVR